MATTIDLDALERIHATATPGEWRELAIKWARKCAPCRGTGSTEGDECSRCNGSGADPIVSIAIDGLLAVIADLRPVVDAAVFLVESNAAVVGGSGALSSLVAKVRALRAKETP